MKPTQAWFNLIFRNFHSPHKGRGQLAERLGDVVASKISTGFENLENAFIDKAAKENRAELSRY